ncbi:hypothetical protein B1992_14535 [Pseudoxanthomonas broegbernensis]|uniref:Toxin CdiA n=1 Tax=Pseudoxanthomonas broegbernensis TaxID=83619 RepID=A0A7V8GK15_9GAMM|nr:hypothetical protein B1992_14535 [Pseudoxanthomonas broegbernensis]
MPGSGSACCRRRLAAQVRASQWPAEADTSGATKYLTQKLYGDDPRAIDPVTGEFNPNLLPEEDKQTILAISQAIGALAGGLAGGNLGEAATGSNIAATIVENNHLGRGLNLFGRQIAEDQIKQFGEELQEVCTGGSTQACGQVYDKWKEVSYQQGGLETQQQQEGWEEFVQAMYGEHVLPLCKGDAACEQKVTANMAMTMVVDAGNVDGVRHAIGSATRAVNIAEGNWVRLGLQVVEDAGFLAQFAGMFGKAGGIAGRAPEVGGAAGKVEVVAKDVTRRPSGFRKKTVQDSWDNAADGSKSGTKSCPTCRKDVEVAPGQGHRDWDIDHQPKWKDRDLSGMERKEVLDEYNKGVRLRCSGCNRSDN